MSEMKVLVIAKEPHASEAYGKALCKVGMAFDVVSSFQEALRMGMENAYCGMVIDIVTLVRSSNEDKLIAYDCINLFPSIRVKWDARHRQMSLGLLEQGFGVDMESALLFFVNTKCAQFKPRIFRRHVRVNICLNATLFARQDLSDESSIKTFTRNISLGGAFLHSTFPFELGETVWVRFFDFSDQTPIEATVRWKIEWGALRTIPGIGVEFTSLTTSQTNELQEIVGVSHRR